MTDPEAPGDLEPVELVFTMTSEPDRATTSGIVGRSAVLVLGALLISALLAAVIVVVVVVVVIVLAAAAWVYVSQWL